MAFWGACVASAEPYTLELDGDNKRLRISQATLEQRKDSFLTKTWSTLRCAVGSKPPVNICSVSKDMPFCQLDLELEESEPVIFTVKGPQLIHLSGYYVPPRAVSKRAVSTSTDDLTIDCRCEEGIVKSGKEKERKFAAEEGDIGGTDSFNDGGQDNTGYIDYDLRNGFVNADGLLVNAQMLKDADERMEKQQLDLLYAFDSIPEMEDENYVPCIRKSAKNGKKMIEKKGEDAGKVTVQQNNMYKFIASLLKETAYLEREENLTNHLLLLSNELGLNKGSKLEQISDELFSKEDTSQFSLSCGITKATDISYDQLTKIGEAHSQALDCGEQENKRMETGEETIVEAYIDCYKNALEEDKENQANTESDHLCQDFVRNQHGQTSSANIDIGGSPPMPSTFLLPYSELDLQNSGKQEKERIEGCGNEKKTFEGHMEYQKNAIKENEVEKAQTGSADVSQGSEGDQHGQKSYTDIEIGGSPQSPSMTGLPSYELDCQNSEKNEKERKEGCDGVKTMETNIDFCTNALEENKVMQDSNNMCQSHARDQHGRISTTNMEIGDLQPLLHPAEVHDAVDQKPKESPKDGNVEHGLKTNDDGKPTNDNYSSEGNNCPRAFTPPPAEVRHEKGQKSKKRKKGQVLVQNHVTGGRENDNYAPRDEMFNHNVVDTRNVVNVFPATVEGHEPANDKNICRPHNCPRGLTPPPAEVRHEKGQKSKKRKKGQVLVQNHVTGGRENDNYAPRDEMFNHDVVDTRNVVNVFPATVEGHEPANDKNICRPRSLLQQCVKTGLKSKKRRKYGDLKPKYGKDNCENLFKEANFRQNIEGNENMKTVLPENIQYGKQYENHDRHAEIVADGCQSIEEYKDKKRKKTKAKTNDNNVYAISSKARTLPNGLIIEDLAAGKSDGKVAAPGRKVKVFYTARLRETEAVVDSNVGQKKPFKFCLGDKNIIEGWNLGIDGMRVGDKRRLIVPPSMGFGKRALDVIPPDSWLVYDIDLVSLR